VFKTFNSLKSLETQEIVEDLEAALEQFQKWPRTYDKKSGVGMLPSSGVSLDPVYLPTNNRIPANSARTPIAREGKGRRTRDDSPVRMSQSAKSSMPIDTTPIVI
jgi:hypothetical protein